MAIFASNIITSDSALGSAKIQRSLRFNRSDNAKLSKTFSSAGNRRKWTFSVWAKFPDPDDSNTTQIFSYQQGHVNHRGSFYKGSSGVLNYQLRVSGSRKAFVTTNAKLRDPSAWYHIVLVIDSDQGSSSDRVKIYLNGVYQSDVVYHDTPTSGFDTWINSTQTIYLGAAADENGGNMYLAECNFIDGSALTPSSFGFTDPVTGIWMPKRYEGTYGTNGFYLDFSDNSSTAALGIDKSPNGNDWTTSNFSVSAGENNDSLEDSPTNNFCTINHSDTYRSGNTLTEGNLKLARSSGNFGNARGTFAVNTGKWYYEWKCTGQHTQVGWVNTGFDINYNSGDVSVTSSGGNGVGMYWDSRTFMYGWENSGGNTYFPNSANFVSYTTGDIIMVAFDVDNFKFWFGKNGSWINVLGTADPSSGTDGITPVVSKNDGTYASGMFFQPLLSCFSGGSGHVNFGQRPFSYTIPTGYKTLRSANLPLTVPSIINSKKHFDTILYTGDNATSRKISGLEFQPDLVWIKPRSTTSNHCLLDSVRGVHNRILPNSSGANVNNTSTITAFNIDGFQIGNSSLLNTNSATHVAWCWKAGGNSNTFNIDGVGYATAAAAGLDEGTANPTGASVNTEAGFSIVQFEAQSSGDITLSHGLGKKPEFWMWKSVDNNIDWYNYHHSLGYNAWLNNSANNAAVTGNDAAWKAEPTSTVFTHGSGLVNQNTIIMYIWTSIPGYSKMGSYTGNGNSDGPYVHLGFRPAFVWIKCSSSTFNWMMYDSKREPFNLMDKYLMTNSANAEAGSSTDNPIDFLSNGFKLRYTNTSTNQSGGTYIYMAYAEQPGTTPFDTLPNGR